MIPIRDTIRTRRPAAVVPALIAANVVAFVVEVATERALGPRGFRAWLYRFALVPFELHAIGDAEEYRSLVTSMFLHGGLAHLFGNMLYLWVFGRSVEDRLGRPAFAVFYLLAGLAAAGTQLALDPALDIPVLGASGAVAGVLGAYLVLFPGARVVALVPLFYIFTLAEIPAFVFLLIWLVFQNVFPAVLLPRTGAGGIAYWAHIGGFGFGLVVAFILREAIGLRAERPRTARSAR